MYCKNCGKEIDDNSTFCPYCGQQIAENADKFYNNGYNNQNNNNNNNKKESQVIGILAIVFSALGGFLGIIFSIIGLVIYKEESNKKLCKIGLIITAAWFVLGFILGICMIF